MKEKKKFAPVSISRKVSLPPWRKTHLIGKGLAEKKKSIPKAPNSDVDLSGSRRSPRKKKDGLVGGGDFISLGGKEGNGPERSLHCKREKGNTRAFKEVQ